MSRESAAQSGKYRSSFAPYQRGPMEDATDPTVQSVDGMFASQLGKTTIVENLIGFFIAVDPAPILLVQPTIDLAESFSKERLVPMIRDTPALKDKVKDARARDSGNTLAMKSFPGGNIVMVGANAPAGLAGRPRRIVLEDEIDRFPPSAGSEGDPCALAERRTESFWNAVVYRWSSPTRKGFSRIETAFELTDKRRWFCPCPKCSSWQTLKWCQVKWPEGPDGPEKAFYECENKNCQAHLSDTQRRAMVKAGEWRPTAPFTGKRGYHLNGIASPFKHKSAFKSRLHQMVCGFLDAKHGGAQKLQAWTNTFLAETYEEEVDRIDHAPLLERGEGYSHNNLPEEIVVVIAGVDVQGDRLEVETVGIGPDDETWGIEAERFYGDTEQDEVWQDLANFLGKKYERDDGAVLSISATAIDMRHKGQKVRNFLRQCGLPRVYPVVGVGANQPLLVTTRFNKFHRIRTYAVNTKMAKDTLFARLRIEDKGPRYCHFPKGHGYTQEYFEQLTAEVLKTSFKYGFPVQHYEKVRDRNEALDRRVYVLAALDILKPNFLAINKTLAKQPIRVNPAVTAADVVAAVDQLRAEAAPEAKPAPLPKPPRPPGGFVGRWKKK